MLSGFWKHKDNSDLDPTYSKMSVNNTGNLIINQAQVPMLHTFLQQTDGIIILIRLIWIRNASGAFLMVLIQIWQSYV